MTVHAFKPKPKPAPPRRPTFGHQGWVPFALILLGALLLQVLRIDGATGIMACLVVLAGAALGKDAPRGR